MSKPVVQKLDHVAAVKCQFVKFAPTEKSPKGNTILEMRCYTSDGLRCGTVSCSLPQVKQAIADAPRGARDDSSEKRSVIPVEGMFAVKGLMAQEGTVAGNLFLVGDYQLLGASSVVPKEVTEAVGTGFDPFQ